MIGSISKSSLLRLTAIRGFSTQQGAAPSEKLRTAFESYRQRHFSRETPSRFRKEFVKAFPTQEGKMPADDLNNVLSQIGLKDSLLSKEEIDTLLTEAGTPKSRMLSVDQIMKLL
uniref:Calmodulin n=1 Tax=Entomoneis paludosa TaxID=265537 RepID=A0A7S3DXQ4_9STRA|mmetsp:Transcript_8333/g.17358  ORF Transcript_8333/g.17358 Transcript_8333/m.17358 type:complete len:115 (+) Transcript_8333:171-515(+)|eukprot:CAMPEP_0172444386 /NCGR_PEP_ID=MMETSP1065-20121228/4434_1 /TAXON_ID=265537 /ORGANISM="Amphiprora paludosa, Strain CCMP125" /LENGTH=114 /DNA_ID=CAMNT_0013194903 /DNA_START=157 /DNA_END=501 /DNA_ORIENTATION=+